MTGARAATTSQPDRPAHSVTDALTIREIVGAARARLPAPVWDYLTGGAESETTLRRNRSAFGHWTFRPRVLRDVKTIDPSTTVLGLNLSMPVVLAPIGSLALFDPEAAAASARAAAGAGTVSFVGLMSQPSLEAVALAAGRPQVFQIYLQGDGDWLDAIVARAEDAGYGALCFTVDAPVYGRRERDLVNRYSTLKAVDRANLAGGASAQVSPHQAGFTWREFERVRGRTRLPTILKGIQHPDDARLAVEHGADMVYVSNHGGRQLDHVDGTLSLLPEIAARAAGRVAIGFDGGITCGTDVVKALALGADVVGIGKLHGIALAAGGEAGVQRLLSILRCEIETALALIGHTSVDALSPDDLRSVAALPLDHSALPLPARTSGDSIGFP